MVYVSVKVGVICDRICEKGNNLGIINTEIRH